MSEQHSKCPVGQTVKECGTPLKGLFTPPEGAFFIGF